MHYDIIIWGATSFVGQYINEYFVKGENSNTDLKIALAGRDLEKLQHLRSELNNPDIELFVGDAHDEDFLNSLISKTRLILSTVGPYGLYGETLLKVCVEQGKDYCDLTGEPQWIRAMLDKYEQRALETGARILHCAGFDSIPSDLGVLFLQQKSQELYGSPCKQIRYRFRASKGGISGGTIASVVNALQSIKRHPQQARILKTPYALIKNKSNSLPYQKSVNSVVKDRQTGEFLAPFVMASINTKVVHRTQYLMSYPWGESFLYDESMVMGKGLKGGLKATILTSGLALFAVACSFDWSRRLLQRFVLAKPGEGPDEFLVRNGFFNIQLIGHHKSKKRLFVRITGKGDPGYGSTSKMISETATLLLATNKESTGVGFLTPAAALGHGLIQHLSDHAELNFKIEKVE